MHPPFRHRVLQLLDMQRAAPLPFFFISSASFWSYSEWLSAFTCFMVVLLVREWGDKIKTSAKGNPGHFVFGIWRREVVVESVIRVPGRPGRGSVGREVRPSRMAPMWARESRSVGSPESGRAASAAADRVGRSVTPRAAWAATGKVGRSEVFRSRIFVLT